MVSYNLQHNGVVERKNDSISKTTRVMLYDQDLPRYLRAKAYSTTIYIQDRAPHRALGKMTFEEAFTGKNPNIGHFKLFSNLSYCHIPGDTHSKLDQTTKRGISLVTVKPSRLIGYFF